VRDAYGRSGGGEAAVITEAKSLPCKTTVVRGNFLYIFHAKKYLKARSRCAGITSRPHEESYSENFDILSPLFRRDFVRLCASPLREYKRGEEGEGGGRG